MTNQAPTVIITAYSNNVGPCSPARHPVTVICENVLARVAWPVPGCLERRPKGTVARGDELRTARQEFT